MNIDRKTLRSYSMLGERGVFFAELVERAKNIENLSIVTADVGLSIGLGRFMKEFPNKVYNVGIAEQNMIGVAAGLAKVGMNVFASTYANFLTMRSFEQIRMNLGYMKFPVKLIGASAGLAMGTSGNSHYSIEDIALMRSIPNMTVVAPADALETIKILDVALHFNNPLYIRLTGSLNIPVIYKEDYEFEIGKAITLREGSDVAIFVTGTLTANAIKAANLLEKENINAAVINMHTIKPLDTEILDKYLKNSKLIVSIEEHSVIGGLGSAIAEYKSTKQNTPAQIFIGLPDEFGKAGEYDYLIDKYGLTSEKIFSRIKDSFKRNAEM